MDNRISSPVLSFTVTRQCNLDCIYCYFPNKGRKTITKDIVDSVIQDYFKYFVNDLKQVRFLISGGEPLLEKDLVFHIMERGAAFAERLGIGISYTLDTNGVLLSKDVVSRLLPYDVYVMSSIDGKAETHNAQRPFKGTGAGSHETVVGNVKYALTVLGSKNVAVRFTVLPSGVRSLFSNFQFFYDFGFRIIDFAPNYEVLWSDEELQAYGEEIYKVTRFVLENEVDNKLIANYLQLVLNGNEHISAYGHPCGIIPTVDTNGDFYSCHRFIDNPEFFMGNYSDFCQILTSLRLLSKRYVDFWHHSGSYGRGCCPANNVCHGCSPFQTTSFFKKFIDIMTQEVHQALLEEKHKIRIHQTIDFEVGPGVSQNEYVLINKENGNYLLLNSTGCLIAQIILKNKDIGFGELIDDFSSHIANVDCVDKEILVQNVFDYLKALQKEGVVSLAV